MHPAFRYRAVVEFPNGLHEVFHFTLYSVSRDIVKRNGKALLQAMNLAPQGWRSIDVSPA